jgi:alginate O-acetyltransferase complex protein AlgI
MVFSSSLFLVYFLPVFLILYFIIRKDLRNAVILLASILFYSWGAPKFIFVLLGTTALDFFLVKRMDRSGSSFLRKLYLVLSLSVNLGLLFYFKYLNFFIDNLNQAFSGIGLNALPMLKIVMPIGISFYTFETVTYVVDVYRRVHKPLDKFFNYLLYIILFPKLIAGPIVRYHEIADQLTDRSENETAENRIKGLYRFCLGLGKKVLIANVLAEQVDVAFALDAAQLGTWTAWWGILGYTFQIYFDFSGYSDMAIGIALMMGFRLPENFNNPYTSGSITEFWRRWHITLGNWMRNYLYIPLGGNKVSDRRMYFNLWIVFLASGLWHCASWNFVIWGAYHGFFLVAERSFLKPFLSRLGRISSVIYTFLVVVIGWVFFRAETLPGALGYLRSMFAFSGFQLNPGAKFYVILLIAAFFSFFTLSVTGNRIQDRIYFSSYTQKQAVYLAGMMIFLFYLSLASISSAGFNPFIYFRF